MRRYSRRPYRTGGKPITRVSNWDIALVDYIKACRDLPFEWGTHDCIHFANNAVKCQRGHGFADEHLGKYKTPRGAVTAFNRWLKKSGKSTIIEGFDAEFERVVGFPPRGSIVAMPTLDGAVFEWAFGIQVSHLAAFVTETGLQMIVPDHTFIAWRVE